MGELPGGAELGIQAIEAGIPPFKDEASFAGPDADPLRGKVPAPFAFPFSIISDVADREAASAAEERPRVVDLACVGVRKERTVVIR